MKLLNKKTKEIKDLKDLVKPEWFKKDWKYLYKKLNWIIDEWVEYEEPESWWAINWLGGVDNIVNLDDYRNNMNKQMREIGNYFDKREEAEKAVEKLKAWKRLKDKGFNFYGWNKGSLLRNMPNNITFACDDTEIWAWEDIQDDLDLLFGDEE